MPTDTALDASMIPWTFTDESGITHVCDVIAADTFKNCTGLTGKLLIPAYIRFLGNYCFNNSGIECAIVEARQTISNNDLTGAKVFLECRSVKGILFKGAGPINMFHEFENATALKLVVFGPEISKKNDKKASGEAAFSGVSGCKIFYSASQADSWSSDSHVPDWNNNEVIAYGAGSDFDMQFSDKEDVVTFVPTTANALTNTLAWAPLFKENLGLNSKVVITNAIEAVEGTITSELLANVSFDSLSFAVKTQAQLDMVLDAVPVETPLSIDPTGATENLTVMTENRKIYVLLPTNGTYRLTKGGFVIIVE